MVTRLTMLVIGALACAAANGASGMATPTTPLLAWPPDYGPAPSKPVDPVDVVRMRDIGNAEAALQGPSPMAISPDGWTVAFLVSRADDQRNGFVQSLLTLDLRGTHPAVVADTGGDQIRAENVVRGLRSPGGVADIVTPVWSPDGRSLVYLKRTDGRTQVWRVDQGRPGYPVTRAANDVESVAWSADGDRLVFAMRAARAYQEAAFDREALSGYLYDERVLPQISPRPALPADLAAAVYTVPAKGGVERPADAQDVGRLAAVGQLGMPYLPSVISPRGDVAGTDAVSRSPLADRRVWRQTTQGSKKFCTASWCSGTFAGLWWNTGARSLIFLRREGWDNGGSAIYLWGEGSKAPRRLFVTSDWLFGCVPAALELVCLRESARSPREIVAIDQRSGRLRVLLDTNPELRRPLPQVTRLKWRNDLGLPSWGDLVIPNGTPPVRGWPLVVVQYRSVGFLRGGTGDEVPIFPLAARGIAVMSLQRPPLTASLDPDVADTDAIVRATMTGWAERRSVQSALLAGLKQAMIATRIDPARIGLSGLSDGSSTVRYALINSGGFAAASIGTCCTEPMSSMAYGGITQADWLRSMGFPLISKPDPAFWRPYSMAMQAHRMDVPILMQLASDEYLDSLETFTALRENEKPVEVFVFPDEHHIKWQPAHRIAIYRRNIDWFAYWLQDYVDPDPLKVPQYARWAAMKRPKIDQHPGSSGP